MKDPMVKIKFKGDYRSSTMIGGQTKEFVFKKGDIAEVPESVFEWMLRDIPGICAKVTASKAPKKKEDRQVKAAANRKA